MSASRYDTGAELTRYDASGRVVRYLAPRILPQGAAIAAGATAVRAFEVDRLDLVAYRVLRNAELAWRIADAGNAMDPFELCDRTGAILALPSLAP